MSERVTKVRVKSASGSYGLPVPIGVESTNVSMADGIGLQDALQLIRNSITDHILLDKSSKYKD